MRKQTCVLVVWLCVVGSGCGENPTFDYSSDVYVLPNPATREALSEFAMTYPNANDPAGLRVVFFNLPDSSYGISIYDQGGELVREFSSDDSIEGGFVSWDLMNMEGRRVTTGIYNFGVYLVPDESVLSKGTVFISTE